jgi:hypothetical protein
MHNGLDTGTGYIRGGINVAAKAYNGNRPCSIGWYGAVHISILVVFYLTNTESL